ncbi:hypothetical protein XaC1_100 [Xanthomonas phage XaC1]|nr:hypothetical protein XaC1_100 [Xanthomonas phage XaC1]
MKSLSQIKKEANEIKSSFYNKCNEIHPKLLSTLVYEDISDHTLYNDDLLDRFKEILKEVNIANSNIWYEVKDYFLDVVLDYYEHGIDIGYHENGEEFLTRFGEILIDFNVYSPSFQLEPLYKAVIGYRNYIELVPFWKKSIDMYLPERGFYTKALSKNSPQEYINGMKLASETDKLSTNEIFLLCVKADIQSPYDMHISVRDPKNQDLKKYQESYINTVVMHKALEELLKLEPNKSYIMDDICREDNELKIFIRGDF